MATITKLYLAMATRDIEDAGSKNKVRLFSGSSEIARFGAPPPRGRHRRLEVSVQEDYYDFADEPLFLALTGSDAWAPRSAFLWGRIEQVGQARTIPLGQNFCALPNSWISQDLSEGYDRWPLTSILEGGPDDRLRNLVLYTRTSGMTDSGSSGPLEFSLFGHFNGMPVLIYQTVLSKMGREKPAQRGGEYLVQLPVNTGVDFKRSQLTCAMIANRGDDAWRVSDINLFGLNSTMDKGLFLGRKAPHWWVSQDPHDGQATHRNADLAAVIVITWLPLPMAYSPPRMQWLPGTP